MIDVTLPLIDLHRHLEGSVRIETILDLGRRYDLPLPAWEVDDLRPYVQVMDIQPGVMTFIEKFKWAVGVLVDYDACWQISYESVEDAFNEGIDYVELRFSPCFMAKPHGLEPLAVVESTVDGVTAAKRDTGMKANLIGIISRTYGPEQAWNELEALLSFKDQLVAVDLAGDEMNFPGEMFIEHVQKARDAGLSVTIHAGESAGLQSVWQAILDLGANRLGHAVYAIGDNSLVDFLVESEIGIESSLTSNVQTSTVSGYATHPLRIYIERGILATINTDVPKISGIDLQYEYNVAAPAAGLNPENIEMAQRNALKIAFLSEADKMVMLEKYSQV